MPRSLQNLFLWMLLLAASIVANDLIRTITDQAIAEPDYLRWHERVGVWPYIYHLLALTLMFAIFGWILALRIRNEALCSLSCALLGVSYVYLGSFWDIVNYYYVVSHPTIFDEYIYASWYTVPVAVPTIAAMFWKFIRREQSEQEINDAT